MNRPGYETEFKLKVDKWETGTVDLIDANNSRTISPNPRVNLDCSESD